MPLLEAAEAALGEARADLERTRAELRAAQQQVVRQENLRALGEMATGVAHELNNALSLILGHAERFQHKCLRHPSGADFADDAQTIVTASIDAAQIVARLREFHRPTDGDKARIPIPLNEIIEQAVAFTRPRWAAESHARGMPNEVVTELGEIPVMAGNATELRTLFTALILNAVDAMPQGGTIALRTRARDGGIEVSVSDSGVGMTEEVRRRCLEPFFTTKGERGSGCGLSMVDGIVKRHGGSLQVESTPGCGATFRITFPADSSGARIAPPAPAPSIRPWRILVVDDQLAQGEIIAHALQRDWHTTACASTGQEALAIFERQEFDLVITDKAMPGMSGDQLAVAVKALEPETRVILLTGFGAAEDPDGQSEFVDLILAKPASSAELRAAIAKVMA